MLRSSILHPRFSIALAAALLVSGCTRDGRSRPVSMWNQSRYKPMEASEFFRNGSSAQVLVPGTVARGQLRINDALYTGRSAGLLVTKFPFTMKTADIARGQERFNIYCTPCHGKAGHTYDSPGLIVQRGFSLPPDYRIMRLRNAPVGHFYDVMTNGYGAMYSYASRVSPEDRWRIAAYIRVLQRSSNVVPVERPRSPAMGGPGIRLMGAPSQSAGATAPVGTATTTSGVESVTDATGAPAITGGAGSAPVPTPAGP